MLLVLKCKIFLRCYYKLMGKTHYTEHIYENILNGNISKKDFSRLIFRIYRKKQYFPSKKGGRNDMPKNG